MKDVVIQVVAQVLDNEYFYGAEHVVMTDVVEDVASSLTAFSLVISILDVPAGVDAVVIAAKGKGSKAWWKGQGYAVAGDAAVTRKRRRLLSVGDGSKGTTPAMSRRLRRLLSTGEPPTATPTADGVSDSFIGVDGSAAAPARRRLFGLADTLSSGLGDSLTAAAGNSTNLSGVNVSASSASASPAIDYDAAKVGRCRLTSG